MDSVDSKHPEASLSIPWQARLITPSVVSERLKVNGSVARQAIRHLEDTGRSPMVSVGPSKSCRGVKTPGITGHFLRDKEVG